MLQNTHVQGYGIALPGGQIGVRFASLLALSESIKPPDDVKGLIGDGAVWQWIHLAPFGVWRGHPRGEIVFSRDTFGEIVANFEKRANPVKVDYEHDSLKENLPGHEKIASGYVHALEIRGDGWAEGSGLYGLTEFTAKAAEQIKNGEFKYNSPVIHPRAVDRKTGKLAGLELIQAAITSDPFLDGQVPITLTRVDPMTEPNKDQQQSLPLAEPKPPEVVPLAEETAADLTAVLKQLSEATGLDQAAVVAALMDKMEAVAKLVGGEAAKEGTPAEEPKAATVQAAAQPPAPAALASQATAPAAPDPLVQAMEGSLQAMSRRIDELESDKQSRDDAAIYALVDQLTREGKVLPGEKDREAAFWVFKNAPDKAEMIYRQKRVPANVTQLTREPPGGGEPETVELTDVDELAITNMVKSGVFTRETAIEKILAKRSN